jgi:hypothetical protein
MVALSSSKEPNTMTKPADDPLSDLHAMLSCIERETHPHHLNRVVNHPDVYPWVKGYAIGRLDMTAAIANPANVCLMGEHGGVLFVQLGPGLYEAHTQVLPGGRGAWTLGMVRAALHWMFTRTDAMEILTKVPRGNLAARVLTRAIGGVFEFTAPKGWVKDGDPTPADIFALRLQDWTKTAPGLVERGEWFHRRLEQEYARSGISVPQHEDDTTHDRYAGMAAEMLMGGQPAKGCMLYNRWAAMAGYAPVSVISLSPLTVDIRDAILCVRDQDFWVITCRSAQVSVQS